MKSLMRLFEIVVGFALCNLALGAYFAIAQDAVVVSSGYDWQGIALTITALGTVITGVIGALNASRISKANAKLEEVHKATNGLTERLERSAHEEGRQVGKQQGVAQQVADDALVEKGKLAGAQPLPVTIANPAPVPVVETKKP